MLAALVVYAGAVALWRAIVAAACVPSGVAAAVPPAAGAPSRPEGGAAMAFENVWPPSLCTRAPPRGDARGGGPGLRAESGATG